MNAVLPQEQAKKLCSKLMEQLDSSETGAALREPGRGRMFGILVCTDTTVLKAYSGTLYSGTLYPGTPYSGTPYSGTTYSGISSGKYFSEGFVPPCYDIAAFENINAEYDVLIKETESRLKKLGLKKLSAGPEALELTARRRELSRLCWEKVRNLYSFFCFDGKQRRLSDIFPNAPSGTGDCCAPRLLSFCYSLGKRPLSMAEFYYGSGTLEHKKFYTPCNEKCGPLLKHILGLDILWQDPDIVVINKPSGLLSIEGKGPDKQDCAASRVRTLFPGCIPQPCIHRLDQSTSGLMVLGLTEAAHNRLSKDFEERRVIKEYTALVEGKITQPDGIIDLPLIPDIENRPYQKVDFENGKPAVTRWKRTGIEKQNGKWVTRLLLMPRTGRTHQLRVHCAQGLGHPVVNDPLYGGYRGNLPLMLCASGLTFTHPVAGTQMNFSVNPGF